jgi:hypothetical protein
MSRVSTHHKPNTTLKGRHMAELHTPELLLPAQSFEEALPFLRRPYTPSQVQAKIVNAPEIREAPCTIALYAIGETPMDRFNLVCAREWSHSFETLAEEKTVTNGKTSWYCMVCATITVFGISHRANEGRRRDERQSAGVQACRPLVRARPMSLRHLRDHHVSRQQGG